MNKKILAIFMIVIMGAIGAYHYFSNKDYVISLSESEIKERLDDKLPITKSYFFIFQITLKNPRIVLENGSKRVNAGLDVLLNITIDNNPKPLGGAIDVSGEVRYQAETGEFFLASPIVENLAIQGIPYKYLDKVNKALTQLLTNYYQNNPIYTLRLTDAKQAVARMVLKNVVVENKQLVITLGI